MLSATGTEKVMPGCSEDTVLPHLLSSLETQPMREKAGLVSQTELGWNGSLGAHGQVNSSESRRSLEPKLAHLCDGANSSLPGWNEG